MTAVELGQNAKAVMLDFVNPSRSGGRLFGWTRQARFVAPNSALQLTRYRHGRLIRIGGRKSRVGALPGWGTIVTYALSVGAQ